ncbi:MAG TPA: DEAD/DEAH box helicase [Streptosporangiaceae bacterium]|jgi:ATP-dependent RNA helicase HelY|nr:DEAD/DEAH box helicase [Streptosporangiaceae bacterium]
MSSQAGPRDEVADRPGLSSFRQLYDFDFDDFQVQACDALEAGHGVLVAAPTGSGKTVVGEFAVHLALAEGRKCFYTTPIKALSNQKYADLVSRYSAANVGLLTGDNSINGEAPVVVMTTEVLRNMLYAGSVTLGGLGYVVLDEVHYLADRSRGAVWEEVIIQLPESVQVAALSATVSNAEEFGDWLEQVRGGTTVIVDETRPVPLWQHMLAGRRVYDLFARNGAVNPELRRLAQRDQDAYREGSRRPGRGGAGYGGHRPVRYRPPSRPDVIERLDAEGLLPAITFIFSRAGCDAAVQQCLAAGLRLTTPEESAEIARIAAARTAGLADSDRQVLGYPDWLTGLRRGIAAHHAGLLPTFKEVVEELFAAGLIRAVFATETLALGINMPARTVVIEKLDKWNGEHHADLTAGEYTQLTGRAGRRGIDVEGHAVVLWQPGLDPLAVAGLAGTRTYPLSSSFRPTYNMAVNLVGQVGRTRAARLLESSFAQFQADRGVVGLARQAAKLQEQIAGLAVTCERGDIESYDQLRRELGELERDESRQRTAARHAEALASLEKLRPGDIIDVPGGRQAGIAVVLQSGGSGDGRPLPLVLTANRQVKRLSVADFPVAVSPIERIRIPPSFSPRSPAARRDLASTVRNRLAGRDLPRQERGGGRNEASAAAIEALRRRLRKHACHGCPDMQLHLRDLSRRARLEREAAALEQRVSGRSHVLARTFGRVCAVLEELDYIEGDEVTPAGRRLAALNTELDLLAAECLRRGTWGGLPPADLAACVSALTFESRRPDDASPVRLPHGQAREVLAGMLTLWGELSAAETGQHLSFLRQPDLGFAWTVHAWARGTALEKLVGSDLTAGDFVRSMKQLIDLLGQLAVADGGGELGKTAHAAADLLRRGVVAYSSVG